MALAPWRAPLRHSRGSTVGGWAVAVTSLIAASSWLRTASFVASRSPGTVVRTRGLVGLPRQAVSPWALDAPEEKVEAEEKVEQEETAQPEEKVEHEEKVEQEEKVEHEEKAEHAEMSEETETKNETKNETVRARKKRLSSEHSERKKSLAAENAKRLEAETGGQILKGDFIQVKELKVGQTLVGVVDAYFGVNKAVFVDVGAMKNALLRLPEMGDGYPGENLPVKKGDKITTRILEIWEEALTLTMRSGPLPRPIKEVPSRDISRFLVQDTLDAEVDDIVTYGAFLRVWPEAEAGPVVAMLHRKQWREGFADEIRVGMKLKVRPVAVDLILQRLQVTVVEP